MDILLEKISSTAMSMQDTHLHTIAIGMLFTGECHSVINIVQETAEQSIWYALEVNQVYLAPH